MLQDRKCINYAMKHNTTLLFTLRDREKREDFSQDEVQDMRQQHNRANLLKIGFSKFTAVTDSTKTLLTVWPSV
jgi:hypothetical protein